MRILSKRQLKELVLHSPQHIQQIEHAGRFPKRLRLGNGPMCRERLAHSSRLVDLVDIADQADLLRPPCWPTAMFSSQLAGPLVNSWLGLL